MAEMVADAVLSSGEVPRRIGGRFTAEIVPVGLSSIAHSVSLPGRLRDARGACPVTTNRRLHVEISNYAKADESARASLVLH
jgi:hypothetical protein